MRRSVVQTRQAPPVARVILIAALLVGAPATIGCRQPPGTGADAGAAAASVALDRSSGEPAGEDVLAMLGGLRRGDLLEGFAVEDVGRVREDGAVRLRLVRDGATMRLMVTLAPEDDEPRAPARTTKYAVYYESVKKGRPAQEEECQRASKALADRIRAVEETVPVPAGMKAPRKTGQPT